MMDRAIVGLVFCALLIFNDFGEAKRIYSSSSNRKSSSSRTSYPSPSSSASNPHADVAKLSYPNYNSQPNRPASPPVSSNPNPQPASYGWNVPKNQGPPPAYSAANPAGGARTNTNENPPPYSPNYGTSSNVHSPISPASNSPQSNLSPYSGYPGAPPSHGGAYPAPAAGGYPPQQLPAGATVVQPGSALPPGAVLMSAPPQSSGPGFGTGLIAGGLGGALTGALLTNALSSHDSSSGAAPASAAAPASSGSGGDKIIIINNGQPVNVSEAVNGTTVINTGANSDATTPAPTSQPTDSSNTTMPPLASMAPMVSETNSTSSPTTIEGNTTASNAENSTAANSGNPPAPGSIICVPVKVNETDPNDATKMIEVDKTACYPAPPPQPVNETAMVTEAVTQQSSTINNDTSQVPLAPLQNMSTQATLAAEDSTKTGASNAYRFADAFSVKMSIICSSLWSLLCASRIMSF